MCPSIQLSERYEPCPQTARAMSSCDVVLKYCLPLRFERAEKELEVGEAWGGTEKGKMLSRYLLMYIYIYNIHIYL